MTPPALVLLAAGLGSRYGGLKQLDPIGPSGATLMDYAVYDGWRAGFGSLICVIRPDMAGPFEQQIGARYRRRLGIHLAFQRPEDLPPGYTLPAGRTRPWGTTQAVLAARQLLSGNFAVLNADDFYGRDAFTVAAAFLAAAAPEEPRHAVVGYRLDQTASPAGGVNRAVLGFDADGRLQQVTEVRELQSVSGSSFDGVIGGVHRSFDAATPVSMNLWAFTPAILPVLAAAFERFLAGRPADNAECYLPEAVQEGIQRGEASVRVLPTSGRWCGVTYASDRTWVQRALGELHAAGEYPESLWP